MNLIDKFSLVLLIILFLIQVFKRDVFKKFTFIWIVAVCGVFLTGIIESINLYFLWLKDPVLQFLIPPHKNLNYFLNFVGMRFFVSWVLALAAALILNRVAFWANKKYDERFFESEEISFGTLGMFLVGWPGFLFYISLILILGLILSIIYTLKNKGRAPLYYFWLSAAIFIILMQNFILPQSFLNIFKIS
jgi:hypothetical protein